MGMAGGADAKAGGARKRGVSISLRAVHMVAFGCVVRNAMDPGFGRLLTPWSVDFYAYFLTK